MKKLVTSVFGIISASKNSDELTGKIRMGYLASNDYVTWDVQKKAKEEGDKTLVVGYKLPDGDGEFIQLDLRQNEITLQSDYFGGRFLYYAEIGHEFVFSTEIDELLQYSKDYLSIDSEELYRYFAFGFLTFSGNLIYRPIRHLESNSILSVKANKRNSLEISTRKLDRILDYSDYANASPSEILQDGILKRVSYLDLDKVVLLLSAGYDSGVILECFRHLNIPTVCGTFGLPDSDDVVIGRERARICRYEHYYSEDFFALDKNGLHDLLTEYSLGSGGIGPATEMEFLHGIKNVSQYGKAIVHAVAGEFFRSSLKSREYFSDVYLTPEDTISRYTYGEYDKGKYADMIYQRYGPEDTLKKFYVEERHPKNVCKNKNHMTGKYGILLVPLANKYLYNYIFSKVDSETRNSGEVMQWLRPEKKYFQLENKINKPYMNINQFFSRIEGILTDYLLNGYDMTKVGVNTEAILHNIKNSTCTERDKWFLSRILNLSMCLTHLGTHVEVT